MEGSQANPNKCGSRHTLRRRSVNGRDDPTPFWPASGLLRAFSHLRSFFEIPRSLRIVRPFHPTRAGWLSSARAESIHVGLFRSHHAPRFESSARLSILPLRGRASRSIFSAYRKRNPIQEFPARLLGQCAESWQSYRQLEGGNHLRDLLELIPSISRKRICLYICFIIFWGKMDMRFQIRFFRHKFAKSEAFHTLH